MTDTKALQALIEPVVEAMGLDFVRAVMMNGPAGLTLQVMAEDAATRQLTIAQCAALSRRLSDVLDEADPIPDEYNLEVSSPGIDRPLTRPQDFIDWTGHVAKLQLAEPLDGRKRFEGRIVGLEDAMVRVSVDGFGEAALPLGNIASAKLVLTDELIKATKPLSSEGVDELDEGEDD